MKRLAVIALLAACAEERGPCTDCATGVHPSGYLDETSAAFHGKDLAERGWDFALCQGCHGDDFGGRAGAPTCLNCHAKGPTACDTCHGAPPITGAHAAHGAQGLACAECHVVPAAWDSPGHILYADRRPSRAQVTFGALANRDLTPPRRTAVASWDADRGTCANVYCHGGVLGDPAAAHAQPAWNGGSAQIACNSCHGAPPANHAQDECATCHPGGGPSSSRHIDATIDIGDGNGSSTCVGCHGDSGSPAPPRGLHGETEVSSLAVGAHRAHLVAGRLRGPIACAECHREPASIGSADHIDTVLPAELAFGTLANADNATPVWDRATATCSGVYCHGGGAHLLAEPSPGKLAAPRWTASTADSIYCGACHGLPPSDLFHAPTLTLVDCANCHPNTVGPFGNILVGNGKHINGAVDFD